MEQKTWSWMNSKSLPLHHVRIQELSIQKRGCVNYLDSWQRWQQLGRRISPCESGYNVPSPSRVEDYAPTPPKLEPANVAVFTTRSLTCDCGRDRSNWVMEAMTLL